MGAKAINYVFNTGEVIAEPLQPMLDKWNEDKDITGIDITLISHSGGIQVCCVLSTDDMVGREITNREMIADIVNEAHWDAGSYAGDWQYFDQGDWYFDSGTKLLYRVIGQKLTRVQLNTYTPPS